MSEEKETLNDSAIVDAKNFKTPTRDDSQFEKEKEEREAAKKNAKPAAKGAYVCTGKVKVDKKLYGRGDEYDGKLYNDLLVSKAIVTKEEWENR